MLTYFGIRPTSNKLHFGHMITLLNMFDFIIKNRSIDGTNTYYILLAEVHAEISSIPNEVLRKNSNELADQVVSLFNAYLNLLKIDNKSKILSEMTFIYQGDYQLSDLHIGATYMYLPLVNSNYLLRNPIFKESNNKSVAFLLYPVLQVFDIILYTEPGKTLHVFVANDQRVNINICKDIIEKLKYDNSLISFHVCEKVLYDNKYEKKMSKSLGNVVNLDDIEGFNQYILKHITTMEPEIEKCPLYINIGKDAVNILNYDINNFDICKSDKKSCFVCKTSLINFFEKFLINYKETSDNEYITKEYDQTLIERYNDIISDINEIRSSK